MPRKVNKRKTIQAEKRKAQAVEEARKNKRWPGTRRVGLIVHHHAAYTAMLPLLLGAEALKSMIDRDVQP